MRRHIPLCRPDSPLERCGRQSTYVDPPCGHEMYLKKKRKESIGKNFLDLRDSCAGLRIFCYVFFHVFVLVQTFDKQ